LIGTVRRRRSERRTGEGRGWLGVRGIILRGAIFFALLACASTATFAQGGPPYYTTDPGTPGHLNWEINFGIMPFLYTNQSVTHTPDADINFGLGSRIQLTYESAWLRVKLPTEETKYGLEQTILGVKWRFWDHGEDSLHISVFPQASLNNPNDAVKRGIAPRGSSLLLPMEFSKKFGPLNVNWEAGYNLVHFGPNGWIGGLVVGHDFSEKLEIDTEFYSTGTFRQAVWQPTLELGGRYRIHRPFILLLMAGRAVEPAKSNQSYFVGYFGVQILLPPKSYDAAE
jgi:hypothetical protein